MFSDTIAAISTPIGEGGISVIRVSGSDSILKIEKIFNCKSQLSHVSSHSVHYGHIVHPITNLIIDEVLITVMLAPRTFTTEDIVEISCHGGIVITQQVLQIVLDLGIRLADPGEFTKRAFLNGRIDLSQAEAVIDLIRSKSNRASKIAMNQINGNLSKKIQDLRRQLIQLMAHIEVNIDYPEHDIHEMTQLLICDTVKGVIHQIDKLILDANQGKILREGITTAIVGKPNVGKSSLLNILSQENKSIVTDIPGTTRDVIEQFVTIGGIPLKLLDTAGIRETTDIVEKIGVERTLNAIDQADLIIYMINHHESISKEEIQMLQELKDRPLILIINKIDLFQKLDLGKIQAIVPDERIVKMSLIEHEGVDQLQQTLINIFFNGKIETDDLTYIGNVRHIQLLKNANSALQDTLAAIDLNIPIDIIQLDLRASWNYLGEIIGDTVSESLIDQIFAQFCLGK
jgi:tRNA modification GTPase